MEKIQETQNTAADESDATRLTQEERREKSKNLLMEATLASLLDFGYHATSTNGICRRAGLSKGGLFCHYPTRLALIAATAKHITERSWGEFAIKFQRRDPDVDIIEFVLDLLIETMLSPELSAWREIRIAARTDKDLRESIAEIERDADDRRRNFIEKLVASVPNLDIDKAQIINVVYLVTRYVDGLALVENFEDTKKEVTAVRSLLHKFARQALTRSAH